MKTLLFLLIVSTFVYPTGSSTTTDPIVQPAIIASITDSIDFKTQIQPIFEKHCNPCHFPGGKMYERMPFDRPQTIRTLGTKMFTRIKEPEEQALLRAFLAQMAPES